MKTRVVHWSILAVAVLPVGSVLTVPSHADVASAEWIGPSPGAWSMAKRWSQGVVPWNTAFIQFQVSITDDGGAPSSVEIVTGVPVIDTLALGAGAQLSIAPGAGLEIVDGLISNDGTIVLDDGGPGTLSYLRLGAGETRLDGAGVVEGTGLRARISGATSTSRLINGATHVIRGSMWLGATTGVGGAIGLTNHGVIEADATGPLTLALRDETSGDVNVNTGVMRAVDGGMLAIYDGGTIDNHGGVIEAGPGSIVLIGHPTASPTSAAFYGFATIRGGVMRDVDGDGPGRIEVRGALLLTDGAVVEGAVRVLPSASMSYVAVGEGTAVPAAVHLGGSISGSEMTVLASTEPVFMVENCAITGVGTLLGSWIGNKCVIAETATLTGSFAIQFAHGFENHGLIDIEPKGRLTTYGVTNFNHASGVIRLVRPPSVGIGTCIWYASLSNSGVVEIAPVRHIHLQVAHAAYRQMAGMTVLHGEMNLPTSGAMIVTGGVLAGSGECAGFVNHVGGVIAPEGVDGAPATFTITGALMQGSDAEVEVDVGLEGDAHPETSASDRIAVSGHATLAGTLRVRLVEGFEPAPGETFTVLTAGSIEGEFESIDSCVPIEVAYSANSVTITFTASSPADLNGDGAVDGNDLSILLGSWGACAAKCCLGDVDRDDQVSGTDLAFLIGAWGA